MARKKSSYKKALEELKKEYRKWCVIAGKAIIPVGPGEEVQATEADADAEAARIAGVSIATINRWADAGALPVALKAPGKRGARMFYRRDVEQAVDAT